MTAWWSEQSAAWIGAIGGGISGLLGAAVGILSGLCVPRGSCRQIVLGLVGFSLCAGIAALAIGVFALAMHQPYAVWYPLVLMGAIDSLVMGALTPVIRIGYRQAEARRLEAEELRRT